MGKILDSALWRNHHTCPAWFCFTFDNFLRRLVHNPYEIIKPHVKSGDTVLDVGPGKGFFTIPIARLVGTGGKVIAADIQQEMLDGVKKRADRFGVTSQIDFHLVKPDSLLLNKEVDFALAFWMLHEVKNQKDFLKQIRDLLKPGAKLLIAEPHIHVTKNMFYKSIEIAGETGFEIIDSPGIFFSRAAVLRRIN